MQPPDSPISWDYLVSQKGHRVFQNYLLEPWVSSLSLLANLLASFQPQMSLPQTRSRRHRVQEGFCIIGVLHGSVEQWCLKMLMFNSDSETRALVWESKGVRHEDSFSLTSPPLVNLINCSVSVLNSNCLDVWSLLFLPLDLFLVYVANSLPGIHDPSIL